MLPRINKTIFAKYTAIAQCCLESTKQYLQNILQLRNVASKQQRFKHEWEATNT